MKKKIRLRRRCFSLIEVLISLGLVSLLLTTLSFFFYQMNMMDIASQKQQSKAFRLRYLESRLGETLSQTTAPKDPLKDFYFFTATSSDAIYKPNSSHLVFTFNNDVSLVDSLFSNHVLGQLFLDNQGNLTLALAPSPQKWEAHHSIPVQREILLEKVDSMEFNFFVPPESVESTEPESVESEPAKPKKSLKSVAQEHPETIEGWTQEWKHSYQRLPALVKITLKMEGSLNQTKVFVFPFENVEQEIVYK